MSDLVGITISLTIFYDSTIGAFNVKCTHPSDILVTDLNDIYNIY